MMDIKGGLLLMVYKFFDQSSSDNGVNNKIKQHQGPLELATHQLAEELHKSIIKKI